LTARDARTTSPADAEAADARRARAAPGDARGAPSRADVVSGAGALAGVRVLAFESRRADELAQLFARHGAHVLRAPAVRETPLERSPETDVLAARLRDGTVGALVLLTGVGTRALARFLAAHGADVPALLARTTLVARGPKPAAALRELGVAGAVPVPRPHTSHEVLDVLDGLGLPAGALVAVQEYGRAPDALLAALAARGHAALRVPVYRWALPADPAPLRAGVDALLRREVDVAVFTSAVQLVHAFAVAADADALRAALARTVVASIGPVCSEALDAHGVAVALEASPPKMGPLVALVAERAPALLAGARNRP
jgi:uroporphyrinogen-III synthase